VQRGNKSLVRALEKFGVCDCHSHVFGPFSQYPLSPQRTFDPPEATIKQVEDVWRSLGIDRAVLVQGSAHGNDHAALLAALAISPETRRGVALLTSKVTESELIKLHQCGIRATRFNWIHHLLPSSKRPGEKQLSEAAALLERVSPLGWHVEIHIDILDLDLLTKLRVPDRMPVVIDHMARLDGSAPNASDQLAQLLHILEDERFWVKVSGADRLTEKCTELGPARNTIRKILEAAPDRCVWGLDWPHVNLSMRRNDLDLVNTLLDAASGDTVLERVLIHNPARLYGFSSDVA
jgi:2-pyrone-4,6-dicarboxylate lactonase